MTQAGQLSFLESSTGTVTISNTGSSALSIAGGVIVAGQISGGGTRTTSASTPPSNPGVGDIWYNTLTDTVARYTSDGVTSVWLDITGPTVTNAFTGGTVTQSIIPNATASYDLGSPAYRFRTLYVTSSTIDIGGVALSVTGGNLQVAGTTVGAASSGTTNAFAITSNTISTGTATGALTVIGGVGIGDALYVGKPSYISGSQIVTTATISTYANLGIPQNSQSAAYTTVASDAGWCIFHPASDANARTFTIAANASVPYALGTVIQFINMSSQAVTIAINSDTLTWAQGGGTGSRTLAQYGVANCIKIATTQWLLTGTNVT